LCIILVGNRAIDIAEIVVGIACVAVTITIRRINQTELALDRLFGLVFSGGLDGFELEVLGVHFQRAQIDVEEDPAP